MNLSKTNKPLNAIIIDDERMARQEILRLLKNGYFVRAVSRSAPTIDIMENNDNYEWQYYDLSDDNTGCDNLLKEIDIVIHLAAQVHIMEGTSMDVLEDYRIINSRATELLASEASTGGVRRFIFLSTIKVNGEETYNRVMRVTDTPNPQDPYAASKHDAEIALRKIGEESEMEYVILRPPLVYGPGVRANFLRLLRIISLKYPLPFASIDNSRSLIYVDNLTDLLISCIDKKIAANKIYLVKDIDISTPDLLREVSQAFDYHITLLPVPLFLLKFMLRVSKQFKQRKPDDTILVYSFLLFTKSHFYQQSIQKYILTLHTHLKNLHHYLL